MPKIKHKINRAKRISNGCRNNGTCPYCQRSRLYNSKRKILYTNIEIKESVDMPKKYMVVSSDYLAHGESEYETTLEKFIEDCEEVFGEKPKLFKQENKYIDVSGNVVLEEIENV